jgi:hypothetical protein
MRRVASQELNELRERVEAWRKQQSKRSIIPDELWDAAVRVAKIDGVWSTARATRFNCEKLGKLAALARRRDRAEVKTLATVKQTRVRSKEPAGVGAVFVELPVSAMGAMGGPGRTVIELLGRHGDRMRIDLNGGVDVVGLVQTLWSRQP